MRLLKQYQEGELVKLLRQGDMKAFDELYFRYVPRLLAFSKIYIKDEEEAREAVQEIFIKIWEKRKSLDESKNFKSYLFQSIKHHFINLIRDKQSACQLSDVPEELLISREDIFEDLSYKELEEIAYGLIATLPEVQKKVFTLRRIEGLTNAEIAAKLNLSIRTVEHHVYLSGKYLRSRLMQKETLYGALLIFLYF